MMDHSSQCQQHAFFYTKAQWMVSPLFISHINMLVAELISGVSYVVVLSHEALCSSLFSLATVSRRQAQAG